MSAKPSDARTILVTGSTDGIGLATARMLLDSGHRVVLHARNRARAEDVTTALDCPVLVGDLSSIDQTIALAEEARDLPSLDAVIHNAGIYETGGRVETSDGIERTFQVNVLAAYILTALIPLPARLVYLTSGMASQGEIVIDDLERRRRPWSSSSAYRDSKLCDIALAMALARRYPRTVVTAVCPGWVRTRMGGRGAPTDLTTGSATQAWLAGTEDPAASRTGRYMRHMKNLPIPIPADDNSIQDGLVEACAAISGVALPPSE